MENTDLGEQLRRLGLHRGAGQIRSRSQKRKHALEALLPGKVVDTDYGSFFHHREIHPLDYRHGHHALADLLAHSPQSQAILAQDEGLAGVDFQHLAFLDTETTGLAGGTGTYAFLVGVGVFDEERFTIHQFFMRDFHEEPALIHALGGLLDGLEAVVSFNGKSFDMPLLETRFIMTRQQPRLIGAPHLDLLPAARRFWKYRLASCALSSLETEILGVKRAQDDVPGWLIPMLYREYVQSGDARQMPGIFYHNAQDILSLVTLAARMCDLLTARLPLEGDVPGEDLYGLGRLFRDLGQTDRAEAAYVQAVQVCASARTHEMAMHDLAYLLKRQERRGEALPWWQRLAETAGAVYACEELAKHYEWQEEDLARALAWTEQGLTLTEGWPPGAQRRDTLAELEHRKARLKRKLTAPESPNGEPAEP